MEIIQDKLKVSIAYSLKERTGKILEEVPASYPFVYIHGFNNIIPGLEDALEGRHLNESFTVDIPFEQGYGPYRPDLVMEVPKDELREVGEIWLGMELEMYMDEDVREFQLPETADEFVDGLNLDDDDESDGIYTIKEIKKDTVVVAPTAKKILTILTTASTEPTAKILTTTTTTGDGANGIDGRTQEGCRRSRGRYDQGRHDRGSWNG